MYNSCNSIHVLVYCYFCLYMKFRLAKIVLAIVFYSIHFRTLYMYYFRYSMCVRVCFNLAIFYFRVAFCLSVSIASVCLSFMFYKSCTSTFSLQGNL